VSETRTWTIRQATLNDIETLVTLRLAMMAEVPGRDAKTAEPEGVSALAEANRAYMRDAMPAGEFVAYVAESDGAIVATSGLRIYRMAPHNGNIRGVGAYVLNMYTVPAWRGRGLASALLERLVEHAREVGATSVSLRASDAGRPVYERYGFTSDASFMSLRIADAGSPE
jgi:GNAT superfamily N-acetyltransferase